MTNKETRQRALHNHVQRTRRQLKRLNQRSRHHARLRLLVFVAGMTLSGMAFYLVGPGLMGISLFVFGGLFGGLVCYHRQIDDSIERHRVWLQIKSAHAARMRLDWKQIPLSFGHQPDPEHPFESDLNLVGRRSLHRLIDVAVSYEGSRRLADWLTAPTPEPGQSVRRQRLVRELAPLPLFRDKLTLSATIAGGAGRTWRSERMAVWLEKRATPSSSRPWLFLLAGLAGFNLLLFVCNGLELIPPFWQITALIYFGLVFVRAHFAGEVFDEAMALQQALRQLDGAFRGLESFSYPNRPHLKALCAPFLTSTGRPSRYLARLARVVTAIGVRGNPILWLGLNALGPWDVYFERQLNRLKRNLAQQLPVWMDIWFEMEALSGLANLAYLNPGYTFPSLSPEENPPAVFEAQGLGHPLIPDEQRVCNDFRISQLGQIAIVTGSNMAGKTVFLKTVGANLALAYAGGPVVAQRLQTRPFRLFTCIQVSDSVIDGISYFYAEVKRLKALLQALERDHPLPLFFYIDEIFRGTNNRERLIGSRAYVDRLVGQRGVGLIATHDLELSKLAEKKPLIENYHFRDHVQDGRMAFDYTLRPGPSPTTNALKIMQMEGLIRQPPD